MLRITIELFPYADIGQRERLAQIDLANLGKNADGMTSYLYSMVEPNPLRGEPIDTSGIVKVERQDHVIHFLRNVLNTPDSGRALSEEKIADVEHMRQIGTSGQSTGDYYDDIALLENMGADVSNIDNANFASSHNFDISFEAGKAEEIMPILTAMMQQYDLKINISTYS